MKLKCEYCGRDVTGEQNYWVNQKPYCNKNCYKHKKLEVIRKAQEELR